MSFLATAAALLPSVAQFASGFFKKKEGGETIRLRTLEQDKVGKALGEHILSALSNFTPGEPFPGKLTVDPTDIEKMGLDQLRQFISGSQPTGELFQAAKGQVLDTLGGKFSDITESPFLQAMTVLAKQNLQDAIDDTRGRRGARGTFFTKAGIQEEGQLTERTQNSLNALIADFARQERERQFRAAPIAREFDEFENLTAPLKRVTASQTLGSLERTIESANLENIYQDFVRQRGELQQVPGQAQSFFSSQPGPSTLTAPTREADTTLSRILRGVGSLNLGELLKTSQTPPINPNAGAGTGATAGGSGGVTDMLTKILPQLLAAAA